jgi:threonine/homoserine/homoserine lactone efflux protein
MAVGISVSDTFYVSLTYLGISQLSDDQVFKIVLALFGGLIMLAFGIRMFTRPVSHHGSRIHVGKTTRPVLKIVKGFILNGFNPFVFLFWVGMVSLVTVHWEYSRNKALVFFLSLLLTILMTDLAKIYLANKLRASITPKLMRILNRVVGIAFIILGLRLLIYGISMHGKFGESSFLLDFTNFQYLWVILFRNGLVG